MSESYGEMTPSELEVERLKLEREALAVERERLAAAKVYAQAEAKLARAHRPVSFFFVIILIPVFAFVLGAIAGFAFSEHQRDVRLRDTLSRLDTLGEEDDGGTNRAVRAGSVRVPLSVTVIQ